MDLADMILTRAKEIDKEAKQYNVIEYLLSFHVHLPEEERCVDKQYSFFFSSSNNGKKSVTIEYNTFKWTYTKCSRDLAHLLRTILRQICRNFITDMDEINLSEQNITLTIKNNKIILFTDDFFVTDDITLSDLSNAYINDNDNPCLQHLEDIFMDYAKIAMSIDGPTPHPKC